MTAGSGGFGYTSDGERFGYGHNAAGQICACDAFDHESMRCVDTPPEDYDAVADGQDYVCPADRLDKFSGECYPFAPSDIPEPPTSSDSGDEADQTLILKEDLESGQEAGGVLCISPNDCVKKCVAEAKYCWAEHAAHPYKAGEVGNLYDCIDRFPKAKYGGSYTCLYKYPNGDACIFAYPAKLGPITFPAPPRSVSTRVRPVSNDVYRRPVYRRARDPASGSPM